MLKRKTNLILSFFIFIICLLTGFKLAYNKPLWNDELYTLISSVNGLSYGDILLGRVGEGSNCPLFYLIQKSICDITQYTIPEAWINGVWSHEDLYSQILLRINPIVFMALAIAIIFHYFGHYHSFLAGIYSVAVSLSSFMIWFYWAEARPYALWVFLTTLQLLIFMIMTKEGGGYKNNWMKLTIVHFLLSLTVAVSIIQIALVSLLLWIMLEKNWKKYILLFIVPAAICTVYYALAPKYQFWFQEGPWTLINASISKDRFLIFFIFSVYFCLSYLHPKVTLLKRLPINVMNESERREAGACFWLTALMIIGSFLLLLKFKLGTSPIRQGFQISNRYFISLAPAGIIATTLFSIYLVKGARGKLVQGLVLLFLAGLLLIRVFRTAQLI